MLKSEKECISIKKHECDITSDIGIDGITSLLIGEKEFYYYLTKHDMFLKIILKTIWIDEQEKGNNIKVKVIGKNGDETHIDYDREIIQKTEKRQSFEEFWETFQSEFDQIEFSNTDTATEVARIQRIMNHNSTEHVKRRYRELLLKYHPDKNKSKNMQKKTNEIIIAYKLIMDNSDILLENILDFLAHIWDYNQIGDPESFMHASMTDDNE